MSGFMIREGEDVYATALVYTGSRIDWINYIAYSASEQMYMLDPENLLADLRMTGSHDVSLRLFDPMH